MVVLYYIIINAYTREIYYSGGRNIMNVPTALINHEYKISVRQYDRDTFFSQYVGNYRDIGTLKTLFSLCR